MTKEEIKAELLEQCQSFIEDRIGVSKSAINRAQEGKEQETKSSAGDKYETTRALLQNDQEMQSKQLSESLKLQMLLSRVRPDVLHEKATFGSVVMTNEGNYFISISAGRLIVDGKKYFAISPQTPLAKEFLQKAEGGTAKFNDREIRILTIF